MSAIIKNIRTALAGSSPLGVTDSSMPVSSSVELKYPVVRPLRKIYSKITSLSNKKKVYRSFFEVDPELSGTVTRLAQMVRTSYEGFDISPGEELDDTEKKLIKILENFEDEYRIKDHFESIALNMILYGDQIYVTKYKDNIGLDEFFPLPMEYITAVGKESQIGKVNSQIFNAEIYVMNESSSNESMIKRWSKDDITHFSTNNIGKTITDSMGRFTYNIWSVPPIESLTVNLLWKMAITINDILLRSNIVPRMHHKLDMSSFKPERYAGDTLEDRYEKAQEAANNYMNSYKSSVASPMKAVDKSIITDKETVIEYVEPKGVTYADPNPQVNMINKSIFAAIAPLGTVITGESQNSYASELVVANYNGMIVKALVDKIKTEMLKIVKKHIKKKHGDEFSDYIDNININTQLTLGVERSDLIRQAAVLSASGLATVNEIRNILGFRSLDEEEIEDLLKTVERKKGAGRSGDYAGTEDDVVSSYINRTDDDGNPPTTPQSKGDQQKTA